MDKSNKLRFSADGTQVQVIFQNEKESDFFTSKEEAFKAITELANKQRITPKEFSEMRDRILQEEKLPWASKNRSDFKKFTEGILSFLELLTLPLEIMSMMADMPDEQIEEAYLKKCDCGKHASIVFRTGITEKMDNQYNCLQVMRFLRKKERITKDEEDKLIKEIEESGLPKMPTVDSACN